MKGRVRSSKNTKRIGLRKRDCTLEEKDENVKEGQDHCGRHIKKEDAVRICNERGKGKKHEGGYPHLEREEGNDWRHGFVVAILDKVAVSDNSISGELSKTKNDRRRKRDTVKKIGWKPPLAGR